MDTSNINLCLIVFTVARVRLPGQWHLSLCFAPALRSWLPTRAGHKLTVPPDRWVFWSDNVFMRPWVTTGWVCWHLLERFLSLDLCDVSAQCSWRCCFLTLGKSCGILRIHVTLSHRLLSIGSLVPSVLTKWIYWANPSSLKGELDFIGLKWPRAVCPTIHTWTQVICRIQDQMSKSCNLHFLSALKILV